MGRALRLACRRPTSKRLRTGGRVSTFDGGAIYWTPQTGAHVIWGGIRDTWEDGGGPAGPLGYPTSDEQTIPGGWRSEFQNGATTYTDGPHIETR